MSSPSRHHDTTTSFCLSCIYIRIRLPLTENLPQLNLQVVKELGLTGQVHGQLLHLIECPPQMNTAVEVTAGVSKVSNLYTVDCWLQLQVVLYSFHYQ